MKIQVFASLKDYFRHEFELNESIADVEMLQEELFKMAPEARSILETCRFAVMDEFVDSNFQLKENDTIYIIPPSSGG